MKKQKEEKRIYVIVPKTVQIGTGEKRRTILMESGRLAAQAVHVARKMENDCGDTYLEYTTIILAVRNSAELALIYKLLHEWTSAEVYTFKDHNPKFYGTGERVWTSVCTRPVYPAAVESALAHLELL